ncbi:MAG: hypothetical protein ACLP59_04365 [Bryobacteraceae bacterium]
MSSGTARRSSRSGRIGRTGFRRHPAEVVTVTGTEPAPTSGASTLI